MRTFVFLPPLSRGSGGLTVLTELVRALNAAGFEATGVVREGAAARDVPCLMWEEASPGSRDIWLVPEGWPNALAPGLQAKARCVMWVQNHSMVFSALPEEFLLSKLPLHYLAISAPVARFIRIVLQHPPPILRPGIDPAVFHPAESKPGGPLRIGWMPRKNKALGLQIQTCLRHMRQDKAPPVTWESIHGLDQAGVADALRRCHLFLATGYPEGFSLPPLEAMASGCLVVGFAGYGGWDYMRQAWDEMPGPWFGAEDSLPGNSLVAPDGDVLAASSALGMALRWHEEGNPRLLRTLKAAGETARRYSKEAFAANAVALWEQAAAGEAFAVGAE